LLSVVELYFELGMFQSKINPLFDEVLKLLVCFDLLFQVIEVLWSDVFGFAFHLIGVADLIEAPFLLFGLSVLLGERSGAHLTDQQQLFFFGAHLTKNKTLDNPSEQAYKLGKSNLPSGGLALLVLSRKV